MNESTLQTRLLVGLDGSNPLAFLAALGTLRALSLAWPHQNLKMKWVEEGGAWRPMLQSNGTLTEDETVASIDDICAGGEFPDTREQAKRHRAQIHELQCRIEKQEEELRKSKLKKAARDEVLQPMATEMAQNRTAWLQLAYPHLLLGENTTVSPEEFRPHEEKAARTTTYRSRSYADFIAALGSSAFCEENGRITDTALRTMSGAGHQHFLGFMYNLLLALKPEHLRTALFQHWTYSDPVQNLTTRWDPIDDARYALQWNDPSGDSTRREKGSVLGANVLAIQGLPLLPTIPTRARLQTVGFTGRTASSTYWTWPIWSSPVTMETCRSLLAHGSLLEDKRPKEKGLDREALYSLGVVRCFRSRRITIGKIRSFTPAEAV